MLNVKVDRGDPTDLFEQVAGEIRRAIADGEAKPGERLPPAKDLSSTSTRIPCCARYGCSATRD
jgi:GntR family transcriptional regulator